MRNKKHLLIALLLFLVLGGLTGDDLVDKYFDNAVNQYIIKDFEKAYSYINFVLKYYSGGELPADARSQAEKIYYDYLLKMKNNSNYDGISKIKLELLNYPDVRSSRITAAIEEAEAKRSEEIRLAEEKARREEAARVAEAKRIEDARIAEAKRIEDARVEEEKRKREEADKAEERKLAEEKEKRDEAIRLEALRVEREKQAREDAIRAEELKAQTERQAREAELAQQALRLEEDKLKLEEELQKETARINEAKQKVDEEIRLANLRLEEAKLAKAEENRLEDFKRAEEQRIRDEALQREALKLEAERIAKEGEAKALELRERLAIEAESRETLNTIIVSTLSASEQNNRANTRFSILIIVIIALVGFFVLAGFGLLIFLFIRRSQQQQSEFESVMYSVRTAPQASHFLPMSTDVNTYDTLQLENKPGMRQLPAPEIIDKEKVEEILPKCDSYSKNIDDATRRKNGARNVAELIFKISEYSGYSKEECMLHFAVGLIYDIGFLAIDPMILSKQDISEEEFLLMKSHTKLGLNMIHFVDKEIQPVFTDGILKHHENLDGTGYPAGLGSQDIPYIARALRVVDSYISMISTRDYRKIMDKESAIHELNSKSQEYDGEIIRMLESLI